MKNKAIALLKNGDISRAMEIFQILKAEEDTAGFACYFLGICHYVINEKVSAHSYFCRAIEKNYLNADKWKCRCEREI